MEALKVVPQIFFDAIARVVPGLTALLLYSHFCGFSRWRPFVEGVTGTKSGEAFPLAFVLAFLIIGSYVVGHLISPFTKMIQRLGEVLPEEWWKDTSEWDKKHNDGVLTVLQANRVQAKKTKKKASGNYEWLRFHRPEAGALCAKIRAEFEMYNGLCVVFLGYGLAGMMSLVPSMSFLKHIPEPAVLVALAVLMGGRGRATNATFQKAVNKFAEAAGQGTTAVAARGGVA